MNKKVVVIIKSKLDASSYYRLYQYFRQIKKEEATIVLYEQIPEKVYLWYYNSKHISQWITNGIFWLVGTVRTIFWMEVDQLFFHSDILVLNRKFFARKMPVIFKNQLEKYLKKRKLIWDFDDNIIEDQEISKLELEIVSNYAEKIVITNKYLKKKLNVCSQEKTILVPTTDMDLYPFDFMKSIEERLKTYEKGINLLWIGSRNNIKYLEICISELDQIAKTLNKKVYLYIICNRKFEWKTETIQIKNIQWDRATAIRIMKKCHLGLMPLKEDFYTLGKAGFKIIQYFGAGIPAVASAVGYNKLIIEEGKNGYLVNQNKEWYKIEHLMKDREQWKIFAINARATYEKRFNPFMILEQWKRILSDMERIE